MMSRIQNRFQALAKAKRKALIPYITAGDPHPSLTVPLPASADNNPTIRVGFHWRNDGDGVGNEENKAGGAGRARTLGTVARHTDRARMRTRVRMSGESSISRMWAMSVRGAAGWDPDVTQGLVAPRQALTWK